MQRTSRNLLILIGMIILFGIICVALQPNKTIGKAKVFMLDVGQGDSFLIEAPNGTQLLIDGGKDSQVLLELSKVMPVGDRHIDVVIATHPDADHIGGLVSVLARYDVGMFMTTQAISDSDVFKNLMQSLNEHHVPAYYARAGMRLMLDQSVSEYFSILFPDRDTSGWETNTASVVGRLDIGSTSALFTGDSPISIEQYLIKTKPKDIDVDILKLGHHGSKTSSSLEYLKATSPILSLISAGAHNRYGHPAPEVVARLKSLHIPSVNTIEEGTTTLMTNGTIWSWEE